MMSSVLVQDGLVTLVALAAAALVLRRVFAVVRPASQTGCANCPSANRDCATPASNRPDTSSGQPIALIRRSANHRR